MLSGGGARGAAHVGVIKVLEELHVPVHCITGTSMGSLVGGAYASGMSVAEMEALLKTISTELLFKEKPPRQDQAIRRKLDDRSILFGLEDPERSRRRSSTAGSWSMEGSPTICLSMWHGRWAPISLSPSIWARH